MLTAPLVSMTAEAARTPATPVLNPGVVLFIDSHRVESTSGLYRQFLQGRKVQMLGLPRGQISVQRTRRDSRLLDATTVMYDQGRYRMWLRSGMNVGYRESYDGLHWHALPGHEILVEGVSGGSVARDPSGGYHLIGFDKINHRYVEMVSDDGLAWRDSASFTGAISTLPGDVVSTFADRVTGSIVAIAKQGTEPGPRCTNSRTPLYGGGRTFGVNLSPRASARAWQKPTVRLYADCTDAYSVPTSSVSSRPVQVYGAPFQRYGDQFLGFPWLFYLTSAAAEPGRSGHVDGPVDTQIASSPDIARTPWTRSDATVKVGSRRARPDLIPRGPSGSWDDGMIYGQSMITEGGISKLYYNGWDSTHDPSIPNRQVRVGVVEWKRDRFMALRVASPARSGKMLTKAFHLSGSAAARDLHVNAQIPSGRTLKVAVLDARTGGMLPGFKGADSTVVGGDRIDSVVRWRGRKLGELRNRPIKLQFILTGGSLYSMEVR